MPKLGYKQSPDHKKRHLEKIAGDKHPKWKGGIKSKDPKKYHKEKTREWQKNNPDKHRAHRKATDSKRRAVIGSFTVGEWENLKKQYGYRCPCCGKEGEKALTIDHIIPLSKGGSNYIENIQPLCMPCNAKKASRIMRFDLPGKGR